MFYVYEFDVTGSRGFFLHVADRAAGREHHVNLADAHLAASRLQSDFPENDFVISARKLDRYRSMIEKALGEEVGPQLDETA